MRNITDSAKFNTLSDFEKNSIISFLSFMKAYRKLNPENTLIRNLLKEIEEIV